MHKIMLKLFLLCHLIVPMLSEKTSEKPDYLGVNIPFYIKDVESKGLISLSKIAFGLLEVCVIAMCFMHLPFIDGIKRVILAGWSTFLLSSQILSFSWFSKVDFIFWIVSGILGIVACMLSLGKGYENTFFALGASYSISYYVILLLRVSTTMKAIILFLICFGGLFVLSRLNKPILYAVCKAAIASLTTIAFIGSCFILNPFGSLHTAGKANYLSGIYILIIYPVVFGISIVLTLYFERVKEKVKDIEGKNQV